VAYVPVDRRSGFLTCDAFSCEATSPEFVPVLGGDLPEGWVMSMAHRAGPGTVGYLCPVHAPQADDTVR
jgi:hypothetical protein